MVQLDRGTFNYVNIGEMKTLTSTAPLADKAIGLGGPTGILIHVGIAPADVIVDIIKHQEVMSERVRLKSVIQVATFDDRLEITNPGSLPLVATRKSTQKNPET